MYTKESLIKDLQNMELNGREAIMVHSSMKSIGEVEGGADTVVDAFMEFFKDGLFMTPTHTWAQMGSEYDTFDPATEPACVGIIPNVFRKREGVVRSLHATHSIAAYGKGAEEFIKGEENATSPCPPGGCWNRLGEIDARILLLGVTHGRNTYIHSVDEFLGIGDRLTDEPTPMHIVMPDGSIKNVDMYRHYNRVLKTGAFSDCFDKMKEAFFDLGAAKAVKFGDADCILCEARKIFEVCKKLFSIEENCIIEREEIPEEWWKNDTKKAIFWDSDGTLLYGNESFKCSLIRAFEKFGYSLDENVARDFMRSVCTWYVPQKDHSDKDGEGWWQELLEEINKFCRKQGVDEKCIPTICSTFREKVITYEYEAYPDAREVLQYFMEKGYENYIISNNFPELVQVFERLGLGTEIAGYVISGAVGYEKPRKEIYEYAIRIAGNLQVKYMIGDNPIADYEGGLQAGMIPVLVHNQVAGKVCCETLSELIKIIKV